MRHGKQKGKLSRDSAHRKSLMMNLSREVIDHERIQTTEAKAKAVKPELERLITLAKKGDTHSRRQAMSRLGQDKFIVYKLFEEIAPRYAERPGGYTADPQARAAQVGLDGDGLSRAGVVRLGPGACGRGSWLRWAFVSSCSATALAARSRKVPPSPPADAAVAMLGVCSTT